MMFKFIVLVVVVCVFASMVGAQNVSSPVKPNKKSSPVKTIKSPSDWFRQLNETTNGSQPRRVVVSTLTSHFVPVDYVLPGKGVINRVKCIEDGNHATLKCGIYNWDDQLVDAQAEYHFGYLKVDPQNNPFLMRPAYDNFGESFASDNLKGFEIAVDKYHKLVVRPQMTCVYELEDTTGKMSMTSVYSVPIQRYTKKVECKLIGYTVELLNSLPSTMQFTIV